MFLCRIVCVDESTYVFGRWWDEDTVTFGMGCFWEPAESLLKKDVIATAVGYAGAPPGKPAPTYDAVCFGNDLVEAVRVAYDNEILSYSALLDHFHECQKPKYTRQYASVIFANDDVEAKVARACVCN